MAWTNAGKVAIVPKGAWSASNAYERLDLVTSNNTMYIAKQDVPTGIALNNTTYWQETITGQSTPIATTSVAGSVMPDGSTVNVDSVGTISIPTATSSAKGLVKPDGDTISVDANGTIRMSAGISDICEYSLHLNHNDGVLSDFGNVLYEHSQILTATHLTSFSNGWHLLDSNASTQLKSELPSECVALLSSGMAWLLTIDCGTYYSGFTAKIVYQSSNSTTMKMWVLPFWDYDDNGYPTSANWIEITDMLHTPSSYMPNAVIKFGSNGEASNSGIDVDDLLTTINSRKVVIQSSAPSDTSALWVK